MATTGTPAASATPGATGTPLAPSVPGALGTSAAPPVTSNAEVLARNLGLTPRRGEVLALIAEGLSDSEIAGHLFVSEATVKSHVNHLLGKISVRGRAQAVSVAYQNGRVANAEFGNWRKPKRFR